MKKLITLTFALFLTVGMAFGQNNSEVDQSGNGNSATINQIGGNTNAHEAIVRTGGISQDDSDPKDPTSDLTSMGTANNNNSTIYQVGNEGGAYVFQGINGGTAINNTTRQYQNGQVGNASLEAYIQQGTDGNNSEAQNNTADQTQVGSHHSAVIKQATLGGKAFGNTAIQEQRENLGPQDVNNATINQGAEGRTASNNYAKQQQFGSANEATILQGVGLRGGGTHPNEDDASSSTALQLQDGAGHVSFIEQRGFNNFAETEQFGSMQDADVFQNGNDNSTTITQN